MARVARAVTWLLVVTLTLLACVAPGGHTPTMRSNDPEATAAAMTRSQLAAAADDWTKLAGLLSAVSSDVTDATTHLDVSDGSGGDVIARLAVYDQRASAIVSDALSLPYIPTKSMANMKAFRDAIAQWGNAIHMIATAAQASDPVNVQLAIDRYNVSLAQYEVSYGRLYDTAPPVLPMAVVPILPVVAEATATSVPPPTMTATIAASPSAMPSAPTETSTVTPTVTATVTEAPPPTSTVTIPTRIPTRPPATRTPGASFIVTATPIVVPTVTAPVAAPRPMVTSTPQPTASPTVVPTKTGVPGASGHTFYTSTVSTARDIYCDTDPVWHRISLADLVAFPSLDSAVQRYPSRALHEPC